MRAPRSVHIVIPASNVALVQLQLGAHISLMDQSSSPSACSLIIYHDGSCALCQREIALVKLLEPAKAVVFEDVSTRGDAAVAPDLTANDAMSRFHVRRADGTLLSGAAAFIEMWSLAPRLAFLKPLQKKPRVIWLLDQVYKVFLVVRPWISGTLRRYDFWTGNRWARENSRTKRLS